MTDETMKTDLVAVRTNVDRLPIVSGETYQHVGRYAGAVVMSVFEQIGGVPRMTAWAESNPTDFYTKLFPKMIQRSTSVDISGNITIDDAIARLESGDRFDDAIDAEYEEIPQQQYDL